MAWVKEENWGRYFNTVSLLLNAKTQEEGCKHEVVVGKGGPFKLP